MRVHRSGRAWPRGKRIYIATNHSWKEGFRKGLKANSKRIKQIHTAVNELSKKLDIEIDESKDSQNKRDADYAFLKGMGIALGVLFLGSAILFVCLVKFLYTG